MNISGGHHNNEEFELNLAPIIDCLTVLIAFMLISASFLSIGILDAGVAAPSNSAEHDNSPPPPVEITITLEDNKNIIVKVAGKVTQSQTVHSKDNGFDYVQMTERLSALKKTWPTVNALTLVATNRTEYRNVVQAMDIARKTIPVVLLGGF